MCLGQSVLRAEPCTGAALLSSVELCHGEEGRQPCHASPLPAEMAAAAAEVTDGSFLVAPNARQKEAGLHLPQTRNRFIFSFFLRVLREKQMDISMYCICETSPGMACML